MTKWIEDRKKQIEARRVHDRHYAEFEMHYIRAIEKRESLIEKKDEALVDAIATIKALHGPVVWDIYESKAPEMQRIKQALALKVEVGEPPPIDHPESPSR